MSKPVRVRYAPSPTGFQHIGGVRTALYNYLFAKKNNGTFILRIEDTDQSRFVPEAEDYIKNTFQWCGIAIDESPWVGGIHAPYRQSERKDSYMDFALQLIEKDFAYYAFDTTDELETMRKNLEAQGNPSPQYNSITRQYMKNSLTMPKEEVQRRLQNNEPFVIRIKLPRNQDIKIQDIIRGWVVVNTSQMDDKVLMKSDGMPTYHLANVVDDHTMEISHVIRAEEWLPSLPLHVFMYEAFGWEMPAFAHVPVMLKPDGNGKLSKRDGDRLGFPVFPLAWENKAENTSSNGFKEMGFLPSAFINMLAFFGWNPGTPQEIFTLDQLIESFSLERVGKSGARFDFEKAKWFNHQHLQTQEPATILPSLQSILLKNEIQSTDEYLIAIWNFVKERCYFVNDFWNEGHYFFIEPIQIDTITIESLKNDQTIKIVDLLKKTVESEAALSATYLEKITKQAIQDAGLKPGQVFPLLRCLLTGSKQGPPIFDTIVLLGKEKAAARLQL